MTTPTKLRIRFSVQEPETERYINFEDDVPIAKVRDFFIRAGIACENLFNLKGCPSVIILDGPAANKISAIKLVREATNLGLKEAKDVVEAPGGRLFVLQDGRDADEWVRRFDQVGVRVRTETADISELLKLGVPEVRKVVP